ncbi:hypothetical protein JHK86_009920 [Glycine max]|nr:hypothetical protein JHK86_009920 [Glycine max]
MEDAGSEGEGGDCEGEGGNSTFGLANEGVWNGRLLDYVAEIKLKTQPLVFSPRLSKSLSPLVSLSSLRSRRKPKPLKFSIVVIGVRQLTVVSAIISIVRGTVQPKKVILDAIKAAIVLALGKELEAADRASCSKTLVLELDNCSLLTSVSLDLPRLQTIRLVHCRKQLIRVAGQIDKKSDNEMMPSKKLSIALILANHWKHEERKRLNRTRIGKLENKNARLKR